MTLRNTLALHTSPLLIRLGLGVVFLWAGIGKIFYTDPYSGENAAILANLGMIPGPLTAQPAPTGTTEAEQKDAPADPVEKPESAPAPSAGTASGKRVYTAEDFSEPVEASRVWRTAIILHQATQLGGGANRLWPAALSSPGAMKVIAWTAALVEFLGGAFVLLGFLTRLSALALAAYRGASLILTTIGPAAVSGQGFLGILPDPRMTDPTGWVTAWTPMLFQFVLFLMALSVALSGPGAISLDRLLFTRPGGKRDEAAVKHG